MSIIRKEKFVCPVCNAEGDYKVYRSVNVDLDKSLREKVLSQELFSWVCPNCGKELTVHYDFLYHDMTHAFMIYYSPNNCDDINDSINSQAEKFAGMRNSKYRTVDNFNQLIEKVLIFESGLDDITIEFAKVLTKYNKENKVPEDCSLVFEKYLPNSKNNDKSILLFRLLKKGEVQKEMILLDIAGYREYEKTINTDERFKETKYCDNINETWILSRMSKKGTNN